jgi:CubicO group peptidase (beta-lactamase class C family)
MKPRPATAAGFLVVLTLSAPAVAADAGILAGAELAPKIDAYVQPFLDDGHLSGTLLVATAEAVLYERSFGMADYELGVANGPGVKHCVASITKPMTVVALARLIEQGKLAYEDPLAKWIPDFPRGAEITVQQLREHTAGLPHRLVDEASQVSPRTAADMVEAAKSAELTFKPGSDSSYSSGGFSVLARVLELAAGKAYQEILEEHVFGPAGITDTAHADSRTLLPGRAASYFFDAGGGLANAPPRDLSFLVGAGSVYSTARDLYAMMRALLDGRYGELAKKHLVRGPDVEWNGVTHGFRAFADFHGEPGLFVIFTSNLQSGAGDLIRSAVPRIARGEEVETPKRLDVAAVSVPEATLRRYEGDYELRPGTIITLKVENGGLKANEWLMIPLSETSFFSPQDYARITVVIGAGGEVDRLDWEISGTVYPLPRVAAVSP